MLDIRFIREEPEAVKENIKKKFQDSKLPLVDEVIDLDAKRRPAIAEADQLRSNRNALSKQIGMLMGQAKKDPAKLQEAEAVKAQVKEQADRLAALEEQENELEAGLQTPARTWRSSASARPRSRTSPSPITRRSWTPSAASTWTPPGGSPATGSITSWGTSPGSMRRCWPMAGTS